MKETKNYIDIMSEELNLFIKDIDYSRIEETKNIIVNALKNNNRLHFTGIGKPGYVAKYMASLFSSTGTAAYFLDGTEAVHGSSGQVLKNDVVIAISNSGETKELMATVKTLNENGAIVIAVTRSDTSWLAKNAKITLIASVENEGDSLNKPPRTSILSEMIILQTLSVALQEANKLDAIKYLQWHPGGSLGASTKEEITNED